MALATARVRRQLTGTDGLLRWASVMATPVEFWTVTVWEGREAMLAFMTSGAHEEIMWRSSRWLESFWQMRWRPDRPELGAWDGLCLAGPEPEPAAAPEPEPEDAPPPGGRGEGLERALAYLPHLRDSVDERGVATYRASRPVRQRRRALESLVGTAFRIRAPRSRLRHLGDEVRALRAALAAQPDVVRSASGIAKLEQGWALAVWQAREPAEAFLAGAWATAAAERWGPALWAQAWEPEAEFGHWDGLRLRRERTRFRVEVPARLRDVTGDR
jgi:hypothetical protein